MCDFLNGVRQPTSKHELGHFCQKILPHKNLETEIVAKLSLTPLPLSAESYKLERSFPNVQMISSSVFLFGCSHWVLIVFKKSVTRVFNHLRLDKEATQETFWVRFQKKKKNQCELAETNAANTGVEIATFFASSAAFFGFEGSHSSGGIQIWCASKQCRG